MTTLLHNERFVLVSVFAALTLVSLWLQFVLLKPAQKTEEVALTHDPDYYVENFTATGIDPDGIKYVLEAERLVHYPDDGSSLLDNPHVIQYEAEQPPRHIYSKSGWLSGDGKDILLTGEVRVIQGKGDEGAGGITTTRKLKLRLKD
ncbi:MAG: LPS export ABC transporter periplasmic protein LptC [Gammaproteobacteria bacterium]|nr:LPS export ABC transporter periplasmic protein LptC [Gammaproteobacteria bacterium]